MWCDVRTKLSKLSSVEALHCHVMAVITGCRNKCSFLSWNLFLSRWPLSCRCHIIAAMSVGRNTDHFLSGKLLFLFRAVTTVMAAVTLLQPCQWAETQVIFCLEINLFFSQWPLSWPLLHYRSNDWRGIIKGSFNPSLSRVNDFSPDRSCSLSWLLSRDGPKPLFSYICVTQCEVYDNHVT